MDFWTTFWATVMATAAGSAVGATIGWRALVRSDERHREELAAGEARREQDRLEEIERDRIQRLETGLAQVMESIAEWADEWAYPTEEEASISVKRRGAPPS
jgi:hypothetical protein